MAPLRPTILPMSRVPKPVAALMIGWALLTALVLPWTASPRQGLVEALLILLATVPLVIHPPLRSALSAQSRTFRGALLGAVIIWYAAQVGEVRQATYPLVSWHMYADRVAEDEVIEAYRLWGERCAGGSQLIPWQGGAFGRRSALRSRVSRLVQASEAGGPALDSLLAAALDTWNRHPGSLPLCRFELQRIQVPSRLAGHVPLPEYVTLRAVTRR